MASLFVGVYVVISIAAFIYHIVRHSSDKFSAIFMAVLTLPWSFFVILIKDTVIAHTFNYEIGFHGKNILYALLVVINVKLINIFFNK